MTNWTGDFVLRVNDTRENRTNEAAQERIMTQLSVVREYISSNPNTQKKNDAALAEDGDQNIYKSCFD